MIETVPQWIWVLAIAGVTAGAAALWLHFRTLEKAERVGGTPPAFEAPSDNDTVCVADVRAEYETRLARWKMRSEQLERHLKELRGSAYEGMSISTLLADASHEERRNLATILRLKAGFSSTELAVGLRKAGSHSVASVFRRGHVEYDEVARDVAVKVGAALSRDQSVHQVEGEIVAAVFRRMLAEAPPDQRRAILEDLARSQGTSVHGLLGITGGLVAANLTGFGLYVAASSTLAAVTGAIGLTLPFAVYTGMSSVLATITGPIGWAVLASWAIFKRGGADYKRTIPGVIAIASARARLIAERDREIEAIVKEQSGPLAEEAVRLEQLRAYLDQLGDMVPDARITRDEVPW